MPEQKQHVDLHRKIALRRSLIDGLGGGAAYVPFIGDGDIALQLYSGRKIYGVDIDIDRVKTAAGRMKGAVIVQANANSWALGKVKEQFAIADFDSYGNPYLSLVAFWKNSDKPETLALFGTDAQRYTIKRKRVVKTLPECKEKKSLNSEWRKQYNFWWRDHVKPYIQTVIDPYRIVKESFYLRGTVGMLYWGILVSKSHLTQKLEVSARKPWTEFNDDRREHFLELIRQGHGKTNASKLANIHRATVYDTEKKFPEFAAQVHEAEDVAIDKVEHSVTEAAFSGNVTAQIFYLQNRRPEKWQDRRGQVSVNVKNEMIESKEVLILLDDTKAKNVLNLAAKLGILGPGAPNSGGDDHAGGTGGNGSAPAVAVPEARTPRPDGKANPLPPPTDKPNS